MKKLIRTVLGVLFLMGGTALFAQANAKPQIVSFPKMAAAIEKNVGQLLELDLEMKAGMPTYTAKVIANGMEVSVYFNAADGTETGCKPPEYLDYEDAAVYGYAAGGGSVQSVKPQITGFSAMAALIEKNNGELLELDLEMKRGTPVYSAKVIVNGMEVGMYFNATTGAETGRKMPEHLDYEDAAVYGYTASQSQITMDKAREIGLARVGGGTVGKIELDHEHGRMVYEMEIYYNNVEYELYVDAQTGEVLRFKQDW